MKSDQPSITFMINQKNIGDLFITEEQNIIKQRDDIVEYIDKIINDVEVITYNEEQVYLQQLKIDDVMLLLALVSTPRIFSQWKGSYDDWEYGKKIQQNQMKQITNEIQNLLIYLISNRKYLNRNFFYQELINDMFISIILNNKIKYLKQIYGNVSQKQHEKQPQPEIPKLNEIDRRCIVQAFKNLVSESCFQQDMVNIVSVENKINQYKMIPPFNASTEEQLNKALKTYFIKAEAFNIFVNYQNYAQFFTYYFYESIQDLPLNKNTTYTFSYSVKEKTQEVNIYRQQFEFVIDQNMEQFVQVPESMLQIFQKHASENYGVGENQNQEKDEGINKQKNKNSHPIKNQHVQNEPWFQKRKSSNLQQQNKDKDNSENTEDQED